MSDFVKSLIKDIIIAAILAAVVISFVRPTIVKQTDRKSVV